MHYHLDKDCLLAQSNAALSVVAGKDVSSLSQLVPRFFLSLSLALRFGVTQNGHKARSQGDPPPCFCCSPTRAFNAIVLRGTKAPCKKNSKHITR
jgi:hypothetical protein